MSSIVDKILSHSAPDEAVSNTFQQAVADQLMWSWKINDKATAERFNQNQLALISMIMAVYKASEANDTKQLSDIEKTFNDMLASSTSIVKSVNGRKGDLTLSSADVNAEPRLNSGASNSVLFGDKVFRKIGTKISTPIGYFNSPIIKLGGYTKNRLAVSPLFGNILMIHQSYKFLYIKGVTPSIAESSLMISSSLMVSSGSSCCISVNEDYMSNMYSKALIALSDNTISVVDLRDRMIIAKGKPILNGVNPIDICVVSHLSTAFVANKDSNNVAVVNSENGDSITSINVGTSPNRLCYCPSNNSVYVVNSGSNNVSVINPATNTVATTITVGTSPSHISYCPSSDQLYVTNSGSNNVSVINPATNTVATTITGFNSPKGISYIPSSNKLFVANSATSGTNAKSVAVIEPSNNTLKKTITNATITTPIDEVTYSSINDTVLLSSSLTDSAIYLMSSSGNY